MEESAGLSPNQLRVQGATNKKNPYGVPTGLHRMGAYNNKGQRFSNEFGQEDMIKKLEDESSDTKNFHALSATPGKELENKLRDALQSPASGTYSVGIHYKGKEYLVQITPLSKDVSPVVGGKRFHTTRKNKRSV